MYLGGSLWGLKVEVLISQAEKRRLELMLVFPVGKLDSGQSGI